MTATWPLDSIPILDESILMGMLHAVTLEILGRENPLAATNLSPASLAEHRWQEIGCSPAQLAGIATAFGILLSLPLVAPNPAETPQDLARHAHATWLRGQRTITFRSSGTTGIPKACPHEEHLLRQELTGVCPLVEGATGVLATAPAHHMFGFTFGLLLPKALGIPRRIRVPLPTIVLADIAPRDILVAVPFMLNAMAEALVRSPASRRGIGSGVTVITATSPTPAATVRTLQDFGFRVIEIFGASETGCVGWRDSPNVPYALLPHFRSMQEDTLVRNLPEGGSRHYPLQDHMQLHGDRHFSPLRRRDDAVQVAGRNVYPAHIANVLEGHAGVERCLVRLMRPEEGQRLKAFVVPGKGWDRERLRRELGRLARERFSPAERPQSYTFGETMPVGALGKPGDWGIDDPREDG